MKKHILSVAVASAVALVAAGGALAESPVSLAFNGSLPHRPFAHRHTAQKHPHARPEHRRHHHAARRHRQPRHHRQGTTISLYERTVKPWTLAQQGCSAARRRDNGVVVLDFGKPSFAHHGYGTILFSGRFAANHAITTAMVGWARGYVHCLPRHSTAFVTLARGTSNYHPSVPSVLAAGKHWAGQTIKFERALRRHGLSRHVASAAADDAEPAWDPRFRKTRAFIDGFRRNAKGHTLYDYGSLDGGVGSVWSARQVWFVAGGIRHTVALPEIYNSAMAREWAEMEQIARHRFHGHVHFAGVMTQGSRHCHCSLRPRAAHHALVRALAAVGVKPASAVVPSGGTHIGG